MAELKAPLKQGLLLFPLFAFQSTFLLHQRGRDHEPLLSRVEDSRIETGGLSFEVWKLREGAQAVFLMNKILGFGCPLVATAGKAADPV